MMGRVTIREGHDNFFTPLRLIFALCVVIGHAFMIWGRSPEAEPRIFFEYTPSYLAVNMFFITSGFLVTRSMLSRQSVPEYSSARLLRIYPALIVHVLFVMLIVGPFVTSLGFWDYIRHPDVWMQPLKVLSFTETKMMLPGAFETNAEQIGSAALWTLRYEMLAYIGTGLLFMAGFMRRRWMLLAQFLCVVGLWLAAHLTGTFDALPATAQLILRFGLCYGLGAAIYGYRDKISFTPAGIVLLGLATAAVHGTVLMEIYMAIWVGYLVFWLAYLEIPALQRTQMMTDMSYGIYIYHWCILQWLYYAFPQIGLYTLLGAGTVISAALAAISWHAAEKPMLRRKKAFGNWLGAAVRRPAPSPQT